MTADEPFPLFPFRAEARRTGIATLDVAADGSAAAGFIPAMMRADGSTEPLRPDDPHAAEVADYVERLSEQSGFATRFARAERDGWMFLSVKEAT
jgi:poly-gamma-glutamate synthesis protein (capsule biosynthesis protein)